jgi:hypothetical protein
MAEVRKMYAVDGGRVNQFPHYNKDGISLEAYNPVIGQALLSRAIKGFKMRSVRLVILLVEV